MSIVMGLASPPPSRNFPTFIRIGDKFIAITYIDAGGLGAFELSADGEKEITLGLTDNYDQALAMWEMKRYYAELMPSWLK